jgi:hypothetical protein
MPVNPKYGENHIGKAKPQHKAAAKPKNGKSSSRRWTPVGMEVIVRE